MKKPAVLIFVVLIAAMTALSVSAAPKERYYDQSGDQYWCNTDSDGCWVTSETGDKEYIMFWSEASRDKIMGEGSFAPIAEAYPFAKMPLQAPLTEVTSEPSEEGCNLTFWDCQAKGDYWVLDEPTCKCKCFSVSDNACNHFMNVFDIDNCRCTDCDYLVYQECLNSLHGTFDLNTCKCSK